MILKRVVHRTRAFDVPASNWATLEDVESDAAVQLASSNSVRVDCLHTARPDKFLHLLVCNDLLVALTDASRGRDENAPVEMYAVLHSRPEAPATVDRQNSESTRRFFKLYELNANAQCSTLRRPTHRRCKEHSLLCLLLAPCGRSLARRNQPSLQKSRRLIYPPSTFSFLSLSRFSPSFVASPKCPTPFRASLPASSRSRASNPKENKLSLPSTYCNLFIFTHRHTDTEH